jgi:hypothetical protein
MKPVGRKDGENHRLEVALLAALNVAEISQEASMIRKMMK